MTSRKKMPTQGKVYLVGGGPGDPKLITVRGVESIRKSNVIIYDALISPELLKHASKNSEKIFVGKRRHRHACEQEEINHLLLKYTRQGKTVCRLKGGDPYVFGRGGEEAETLAENGVPYEIISGVSSIIAVPAAAGIPITHRKYSSFVTIATGHEGKGDWCRYFSKKTLLILMGFARLDSIAQQLIQSGWAKESPVALICSGTLSSQITVAGTLSDINAKVKRLGPLLSSPAMIVVGEVVRLRENIVPCGLSFDILSIEQLKPHEGVIASRVQKIKNDLLKNNILLTPLWIEKKENIILNGHHRLQALKELSFNLAPCFILNYDSPYVKVQVCPGSQVKSMSKKSVLEAARTGRIYPPRSSFHIPKFEIPDLPVALPLLR